MNGALDAAHCPFALPQVDACVFCDMAAGRADKGLIEETPLTMTLVNHRQYEVGQTLVVPKRHAPTLLHLTDEEAAAVALAARRVAAALVAAYAPDGVTLYQNNGVASLQEIPHFHLHVVPRRIASAWGDGPPHIAALQRAGTAALVDIETERAVAARVRAAL